MTGPERPAAGRKTEWLNRRQASGFMAAHRVAESMGRPLNLTVTLNASHTCCNPIAVSTAFERLRDNHFTRWFRYQSKRVRQRGTVDYGPPTYTWVIEAKDGYPHIHWNLHMPAALKKDFLGKVEGWFEKVAGEITMPLGAIHSMPITNSRGYARYCMKGLDPHHAKAKFIRHEPQGTVFGKRCGVSANLGPSARKQHRATRMAA